MAGIPSLVGFDFTYGMSSQTPALARLLADAGSALGKSIETFAQRNEAATKAPMIQQAYAAGYAKITTGDFSGFQDMAAASSMAAGNPMLMQMAKEANDLGTQLATSYTQTALAKERFKLEDRRIDLTEERIDRQETRDTQRHADMMAKQDDAQAFQERQAIVKENQARESRNRARQMKAEATGSQPEGMEQLLPVPEETAAPRAQAVTPQEAEAGAGLLPTADSRPAAQPRVESASAARKMIRGIPGLPKVEPDLPVADAAPTDALPPVSEAASKEVAADRQKAEAAKYAPPTKTPEQVELQLGNNNIVVRMPKGQMKDEGMTINEETGSVSTTLKVDNEKKKDREDFIEGVAMMQGTNPDAANFVAQYLAPRGKGIKWANITREGGKVISAEMYGIGKDGKPVPFTTQPPKEGEPPAPEPVDGEFYAAHLQTVKSYPKIKDLVDIKGPPEAETAAKSNLADKIRDPEIRSVVEQARKDLGEGKISEPEARRRILTAYNGKKERQLADDKYTLDEEGEKKEKEGPQRRQTQKKVEEIKSQIADIEKKLERGTTSVSMFSMGGAGSGNVMTDRMTATERNKLVLQRSNLLKRLQELQ